MDNYLMHHGILGQKWGVRRFQNPDGSLTAEGRERYKGSTNDSFLKRHKKEIVAGAVIAGSALAVYGGYSLYKSYGSQPSGYRTYGINEPLSEHLNDLPDKDITLKSGERLQRVSSSAIEDLTNKGHIYVSHLFRDNQRYLSGFRKEINTSGNLDFVHRITPNDDLKIASPKTAAEAYLKLYPKAKENVFRMVLNPYTYRKEDADEEDFSGYIVKQREALIKELKNRGYGGVVDLEDSVKVKGSEPIIIFNPNEYVTVQNSRKINQFETFVADILK